MMEVSNFVNQADKRYDLDINISDCMNGEFHNVREIIAELENYYNNFKTGAMNPDIVNVLTGEKMMLEYVIGYLKKIVGEPN